MTTTTTGDRTLALCDAENLTGTDPRTVTASDLGAAIFAFTERADLRVGDQLVIAVNPGLAFPARAAAPTALLRCRSGENGADLALLDELEDVDHVVRRFGRVVIGSGDGIFADAVIRLNHTDVRTVVVADFRHLARRLRLAAQDVRSLPGVTSRTRLAAPA